MASETREVILDAALQLFAKHGFHGSSMPALATAAGVGSGTPYRHFESKEALVNALYRRTKEALMGALLTDFPLDATDREQFRAFFFRLVGFFAERPDAFDFLELHHHQPYLDDANMELERLSLAPVLAFFQRGRAERRTRAMPPEALTAIVWGLFSGLHKALRLGHLEASPELWAQAEASAWDAVRRPGSRPPASGQEESET